MPELAESPSQYTAPKVSPPPKQRKIENKIRPVRTGKKSSLSKTASARAPEQFTTEQYKLFNSATTRAIADLEAARNSLSDYSQLGQYASILSKLKDLMSVSSNLPLLLAKNGGNLLLIETPTQNLNPDILSILNKYYAPVAGVSILLAPPNEFQPEGAYLHINLSEPVNLAFQNSSINPLQSGADVLAAFKPRPVSIQLDLPSPYARATSASASYDIAANVASLNKLISDYLLSSTTLNSLPRTSLGNYVRSEHAKWTERFNDALSKIQQFSASPVIVQWARPYAPPDEDAMGEYAIRPQSMKAGLTSAGEPFVVLDKSSYEQAMQDNRYDRQLRFKNSIVLPEMPEGASALFEYSSGRWAPVSHQPDWSDALAPALRPLSHHLSYLVDQTEPRSIPGFDEYGAACGHLSLSGLLQSPDLFFSSMARAAALLIDGKGPMEAGSLEGEKVLFFSFEDYTTKPHHVLFGRQGDTYYAVDAEHALRGSGKTKQQALTDLATSGYCLSGVYYYFDKKADAPYAKPQEILALPDETKFKSRLRDFSAYASWPTFAAMLLPANPYTTTIALVGLTAQTADRIVDANDRAFHKGEDWNWASAEGCQVVANLLFIASIAAGYGRLPSALGASQRGAEVFQRLTSYSAIGTYTTGRVLTNFARARENYNETYEKSGQPASARNELPQDSPSWLFQSRLAPLYKWTMGLPESTTDEKVLSLMSENWMGQLLRAAGTQTPAGPEGSQVLATQIAILAQNADWLHDNHTTWVPRFEQILGWPREDVVLQLLKYGGPLIEEDWAKTETLMSRLNRDAFKEAAMHLYRASAAAGVTLDVSTIYADLKLSWIQNQVGTSQVLEWARQEREATGLRPSTDTTGPHW